MPEQAASTAGAVSADIGSSEPFGAEGSASAFAAEVDQSEQARADNGTMPLEADLGTQMQKAQDFDAAQGRGVQLAQATTGVITDATPVPGRGPVSVPKALGPAAAAAAAAELMNRIDDRRERAAVEAALANPELGLNPALPADVNAARAYVWGKNMAPFPGNYSDVPWSGPVNERAARSIMQLEQAVPGTLGLASQGDAASRARLDEAVAGALAGAPVERTSTVDPALSTNSTRARAIAAATAGGMQNWQAHHLVPFETMNSLPVTLQAQIAASGWRLDSTGNLIALPADQATFTGPPNNTTLPMHRGSHPVYSADAAAQFANLVANHQNMTPPEIRAELTRIETQMKTELLARVYHNRVH